MDVDAARCDERAEELQGLFEEEVGAKQEMWAQWAQVAQVAV